MENLTDSITQDEKDMYDRAKKLGDIIAAQRQRLIKIDREISSINLPISKKKRLSKKNKAYPKLTTMGVLIVRGAFPILVYIKIIPIDFSSDNHSSRPLIVFYALPKLFVLFVVAYFIVIT